MAPINVGTLTDIGFVVFVSIACWQSLFAPARSEERRRGKWKAELTQVESMLKTLITEAGSAGVHLQTSLLERQRELETLLERIEGAQGEPTQFTIGTKAAAPRKGAAVYSTEVPNESWLKPFQVPVAAPAPVQAPKAAPVKAPTLETLAAQRTDQVSLSAASMAAMRPAPTPQAARPDLNSQIEMTRAATAQEFPSQNSPVRDPMAYQVAKRLLAEGKEIHVVSRKLELPLAEVRMLDKLMRQEQSAAEAAMSTHIVRNLDGSSELARSVSENLVRRAAPAPAPTKPRAPMIERERALL